MAAESEVPQFMQNFAWSGLFVWQLGHFIQSQPQVNIYTDEKPIRLA
jgi:hypothetical protein